MLFSEAKTAVQAAGISQATSRIIVLYVKLSTAKGWQ
jgi:hypothetical protein